MGFYSADQIEAMSQTTVRMATLAELRLTSGTVRVFAGAGVLKAAGFTWTGIGQIARIEGLKALRGTQASQVRVLMPAVPITLPEFPGVNFVDQIFTDVAEVKNRLIVFYSQLMDDREQAIGPALSNWFGLMQPPAIDRIGPTDDGGPVASMSLSCETLFYGRARPKNGRYTDSDQQRRFPGDRFCERVTLNRDRTLIWPRP